LGFELRIVIQFRYPVRHAVGANFMSPLNHAFEELDIVVAPIDFAPIRMLAPVGVNRIRVGNEEKCGREAMPVEKRNAPLELATQPVIKRE
jgi:hypothetical protein